MNKKFTVVVFHDTDKVLDTGPDGSKPYFIQAYCELAAELASVGGRLVHAVDYQDSGVFPQGYEILKLGEVVPVGSVKADVIFDKGGNITDTAVPVFNHPDIAFICTDKKETARRFPQYSAQTELVRDRSELMQAVQKISTQKVVIKPLTGSEGYNIYIGERSGIPDMIVYPSIVQSFLDTTAGIPGIIEGMHDFRVALYNGEIIYSYVRTPPTGKMTANVAQGGTFRMIPVEQVPANAIEIALSIDSQLAYVGERFYGIDFAFTPQGIFIIEMNSRLGILPNSDGHEFVTLKKKMAQTFKKLAQIS